MTNKSADDRALFDRIAPNYAKKDKYPVSAHARLFQLDCLLAKIKQHYEKPWSKVLEIGCGTGGYSPVIDRYSTEYIGVDHSDKMIAIAKRFHGKSTREFLCFDASKLVWNKEKPDVIIGIGVMHHLEDLPAFLRNIGKMGHQNTTYGFLEPLRGNLLVGFLRWFRKKMDKDYSNDQRFYSREEFEEFLNNSGFSVIEARGQGFFSPPFAQVILKPVWLFMPLSRISVVLDRMLFGNSNSDLAWNLLLVFKRNY